ncbi:hypothetical protein E3Q16_03225 [Wallemia mellicola]|nr:hypothetical protein E3Q24_04153 [Wallemia mellicola]TIC03154.1 hypothetical protein E3Q16_03225 [Wallemia mellicola]TIC21448.1 hypothetical protein E3Q12_03437 [Wallemia mellicola]TIC52699.1 hypothetical protein E3Q04_03413 [Wallemia mellicola]
MSSKLKLIALPLKAYRQTPPITLLTLPPKTAVEANLMTKAVNWSDRQWNKLSESPEGHWKKRIWNGGEAVMDRVPYEEWALKHIEPAHGVAVNTSHKLDILYPESMISDKVLLDTVKESFISRSDQHRKKMWLYLAISPVTFPVAIIPIVPNLPLFYLLWRAWSHWRAHRGANYLGQLHANSQLQPRKSEEIDRFYQNNQIPSLKDINTLSKILNLPAQATLEGHRAIKQIHHKKQQ